MDYSDREHIISQICNGLIFVDYKDEAYIFEEPYGYTIFEFYQKRRRYELECIEDGFLDDKMEEEMLRSHGLWRDGFDKEMEELSSDLRTLQKSRNQYRFRSNEIKRVDSACSAIKTKVEELQKERKTFFDKTAKYNADLRAKYWLLFKCLKYADGSPVWKTWDSFEEETDLGKISGLCVSVFYKKQIRDKDYRAVSRNEPWRSTWRTSCKTGTSVFPKSASEFTESQKVLTYWSLVYDNVYESMECPPQEVIEDDDQLDIWFEQQSIKAEESRKNKQNEGFSPIANSKIAGMSEVFIPVDTTEDAKKVYNELNTSSARKTFSSREATIKKKGSIKEQDMPDTKRGIGMQATELMSQQVKNR